MKRFIYIAAITISSVLFTSCVSDVNDIFDKSAAERMNIALREYNDILAGAENGWLMEYYPEGSRKYGGVSMIMSFDKAQGYVTVASELAYNQGNSAASTYSLDDAMGPCITFDTYNEYIHYFSDPDLNVGGGRGVGYEGDFEFVFKEVSKERIILSGKKTKNRVVMTPMPAEVAWQDHLTKIHNTKEEIQSNVFNYYDLIVDGTKIMTIKDGYNPVFNYVAYGETNPDNTTNEAYLFTDKGIKLYDPIVIANYSLQNFEWNAAGKELVCVDRNVNAVLKGQHIEKFIHYDKFLGTWRWTAAAGGNTTVTLAVKEKNKSYTMTGLHPSYDVTINYVKEMTVNGVVTSGIEILGQYVGDYNGNDLLFCGLGEGGRGLYPYSDVGVISDIKSQSPLTLNLIDNGVMRVVGGMGFFYDTGTGVWDGPGAWLNIKMTKQ